MVLQIIKSLIKLIGLIAVVYILLVFILVLFSKQLFVELCFCLVVNVIDKVARSTVFNS